MKNGWQTKKLGEVCDVDKSQGIYKNLPYVGLEQIESHTGRFIGSTGPVGVKSSTFKFSPEHVLYGRLRPYLNKVMLPDFSGHCSTEIFPLKPHPGLSREFLQYWFLREATVEQIDATSTGARMPRANMNAVLDFEFPLPPLPEQQRIVGILDEAFKRIAIAKTNTETNLQNARGLFESYLRSVFTQRGPGWVEKTVEEIAAPAKGSIRTGPFGSQLLHGEFVDEGIAVLGIDNAVANEFRWGKSRFITPEKYRQLERYTVHPGDVLITIMGTCGRCAVVPDDIPIAINTKHLCCITLDRKKCLPGYLHIYFLHAPLAQKFLAKHAKGAIMAGLNMGLIQELPVMLPPIEVQAAIVKAADDLREETQRLESIYQQKLVALEALKKSLLHQAFTGKL
jgi:type I restriction enzyme, S subunit